LKLVYNFGLYVYFIYSVFFRKKFNLNINNFISEFNWEILKLKISLISDYKNSRKELFSIYLNCILEYNYGGRFFFCEPYYDAVVKKLVSPVYLYF